MGAILIRPFTISQVICKTASHMPKPSTNTARDRLAQVQARIHDACRNAQRDTCEITLLAVGKTKPVEDLRALAREGQIHFGENHVQEALGKQQALDDPSLIWHFIGPVQSNKTRGLAQSFHWVHTVDRLKIARRLSEQRPQALPPLNICLQVNISAEPSKSGIRPDALPELARQVSSLPRLRLRGLMAIPAPETDPRRQRASFAALRTLMENLRIPNLDTLSMGMSGDLEAAVFEGSTMLRIGAALFGPRQPETL